MNWTINLMYIVMLTSMTGTIVTLIGFAAGKLLERMGFLNVVYYLLQIGILFWIVPVAYGVLWLFAEKLCYWQGLVFATTPALLTASKVFCLVWLLCIAICLIGLIIQTVRNHRIVRMGIVVTLAVQQQFEDICAEYGLKKHSIRLKQSYACSGAKVIGAFVPTVVLPMDDYTPEQLDIILRHELTHIRHHDLLTKNLAALVCAIHTANPLAWLTNWFIGKWSEYACDYTVCKAGIGLRKYFEVIVELSLQQNSKPSFLTAQFFEQQWDVKERMKHVMKCYKVKNKSRAGVAALVACMILGSSVSVSAAMVTVAEIGTQIYQATDVENADNAVAGDQYVEYIDDADSVDIVEVEGTVKTPRGSSSGTFNWDIPGYVLKYTSSFSAKSGQTISVAGVISPSDKTVKVGIVQPDGTKRYINASGSFSHDFALDQTGSYNVYITNTNSTEVTVLGGYSTE
jgi:beta-lactamase regulating signal transducer with metallopeptidase domain